VDRNKVKEAKLPLLLTQLCVVLGDVGENVFDALGHYQADRLQLKNQLLHFLVSARENTQLVCFAFTLPTSVSELFFGPNIDL